MNNREYLAANPEKLAEVAAKGVCDCCAYRDAVPCGDCDEGVGKWLVQEHQPETFHDEFYDCESTVDKAEPQGADGNFDQAQVEWLRCMPDGWDGTPPEVPSEHTEQDTREKLEEDWAEFYTTHERECLYQSDVGQFVFDLLDRQAAITEREGREAWHKAASGEIYQANQRAKQILAEYDKLQKELGAMIGCPGYDAPSHSCRYHDQDFELNDRTVNALKRENAKLQEQIDRILRAPNLSKGVNMQLVEGVEALNERVSDLEAEVEQYELLCQRWEDLYHAVRDQRNAMRDRLAELEKGEGHE